MSRNSFTLISKAALGLIAAWLLAEVVLRLAPVYDVDRVAGEGELTHLRGGQSYTYSKGWRFLSARTGTANSQGFNAPLDYARGAHGTAVIGDSFAQALMLESDESLGGWLGGPDAYALVLADGGYSLADYLVAARHAGRDYGVQQMVILIVNGDVEEAFQDTYRGKNVLAISADQKIALRKSTRTLSPMERLFKSVNQYSLVARYLTQNLVVQARLPGMYREIGHRFWSSGPAPGSRGDAGRYDLAIDFFLRRIVTDSGLPAEKIVLLFDADRPGIYRNLEPTLDPSEERFKTRARAAGFPVVDLNTVFLADYLEHFRRFDFSPEDGHWNAYGHHLAARSVAKRLSTSR